MNKNANITVVGSNNIDLTTYLINFPNEGETIYGKDFQQGFGGKGSNQAVMASLLGADVSMVTCIGDDAYGQSWLELYKNEGIRTDHVVTIENQSSGVASIWVEENGDNRIVIVPGANNDLSEELVAQAFENIKEPKVVLSQLENPQAAILEGFKRGKSLGATTILNPAPAAILIDGLLNYTDWLVPNEKEFALIAREMFDITSDNIEEAIKEFAKQSNTNVVVTLGDKGALYVLANEESEVENVETIQVAAKDTTGAGDAFCGTFAYGLAMGFEPNQAIKLANVIASDSVTNYGTQKSYPRDEALNALVQSVLS